MGSCWFGLVLVTNSKQPTSNANSQHLKVAKGPTKASFFGLSGDIESANTFRAEGSVDTC